MVDEDETQGASDDVDQAFVGTPRWVKVCGLIAIVVLIAIAIVLITGAGGHGPGRHSQLDPGVGALSMGGAIHGGGDSRHGLRVRAGA